MRWGQGKLIKAPKTKSWNEQHMVTCPLGVPASRQQEKPLTEAGIQERVDTVGAYVTGGAGTAHVTVGAGAAYDRLALARCTPPLALAQPARLELAPRRIRLVLARSGCPQRMKIASPRKPLPLTTKRPDTTSAALKFPVSANCGRWPRTERSATNTPEKRHSSWHNFPKVTRPSYCRG